MAPFVFGVLLHHTRIISCGIPVAGSLVPDEPPERQLLTKPRAPQRVARLDVHIAGVTRPRILQVFLPPARRIGRAP